MKKLFDFTNYENRLQNIYQDMFPKSIVDFCGEAQFNPAMFDYKESGLITGNSASHRVNKRVNYYINKNGIIGKEFIENAEILAAGCSFTAGIGLSTGLSWPFIVGEKTQLSFNQLGIPGGSIQQIATAIFEFIKIYGKPKHLLFLVPEIGRQWMYTETYPYRERFSWSETDKEFLSHESFNHDQLKDKIAFDIVVQNSFSALRNIQDFCEIEGINFKFFSWHFPDNRVYSSVGIENFVNFIDTHPEGNCQHDGTNIRFWDEAADKVHASVHRQIHFAEGFLPL